MSKLVSFIILLFLTNFASSQVLNGIWRIGYIRSINQIASINDPSDTTETYQAFRLGHGIFEFEDGRVTIHNFISEPQKQEIKTNNLLRFKGNDLIISSFNKDSVVLRAKNDNENYMVLIPFESANTQISEEDFQLSEWQLETERSAIPSVKFHFSDTNSLVCNYHGERIGYANYGEWRILRSGNFNILLINDRQHMHEYVFYCSSRSKESISAIISEQNHLEYPTINSVNLIKQKLLTDGELKDVKEELLGTWEFVEFMNHMDTLVLDSLINIKFSLKFMENGKYEYSNAISSLIMGEFTNYTSTENRTWQIARNGTYIISQADEDWEEYFSIYSLDQNILILDLNYEVDERSTFAARIKLERND